MLRHPPHPDPPRVAGSAEPGRGDDVRRSLQNSYAHLARANELSEMAAAISHEINQPLTAIVNYLNSGLYALAAGQSPEAFAEAEEVMLQASAQALRAGEIVRKLRDFVGKTTVSTHVEPLEALVDAAADLALIDAPANGIAVERISGADGARVRVDRAQIQQVVVNLLHNALDALLRLPPHRERRLTIVTADLPDQAAVEIGIIDTGSGIAPELRTTLFEPFVTTKTNGMGIGLSICRRFIEAHGGSIRLEDSPAGAAFRVRLPRVAPD